ncbi:ankyrin repeat domain-containing protein [Rugamonas sp. CCM 8940]|uniref:ankyrin repeat domain-containing protein n=1 Tax=Rugamonas sp. CCM 8940 TaxID=2765359 RepID=UPI001F18C01B|nr:ankyrin repeat domain-containing protein [Rugamonas sp. CCM 8940]
MAALAAGLLAGHAGLAMADAAEDAVDYFRAVQLDNVGVIRRVLAKGLDPNIREPERGETGLIVAMRYEAKDTLKLLLAQPGIDLDAKAPNGNTALMMAAFRQNKPAVLTLIGAGASINQSGWTALHYAAAAGSIDISNLLLDRQAQIDAMSPSGMTPLMLAAREGQEEVVKLLLARGADATLKDGGFHLTAAEFAIKADKPWIAKAIQAHLAARPTR